jgi:hypothetical protein
MSSKTSEKWGLGVDKNEDVFVLKIGQSAMSRSSLRGERIVKEYRSELIDGGNA